MIRQIAHTFLFIILYSSTIYSQGWFWQNPLPQGNYLSDIHVFDENTAISVGAKGTMIKTTDGGTSWNSQTSGTTEWLISVHFTDNNNGWAVGGNWDASGIILKTTDGGENWNSQTSGTTERLWSVHFIDNNTGWAVGEDGTILRTTNAGTNWNSQTSGSTHWLTSVY